MEDFKIGDEVEFIDENVKKSHHHYKEIKNFIVLDELYTYHYLGGTVDNPVRLVNLDGFTVEAIHLKLKEIK